MAIITLYLLALKAWLIIKLHARNMLLTLHEYYAYLIVLKYFNFLYKLINYLFSSCLAVNFCFYYHHPFFASKRNNLNDYSISSCYLIMLIFLLLKFNYLWLPTYSKILYSILIYSPISFPYAICCIANLPEEIWALKFN